MARREEGEYREYATDEQRSQPRGPQRGSRVGVEQGCPARELWHEPLGLDTSLRILIHPCAPVTVEFFVAHCRAYIKVAEPGGPLGIERPNAS